MQTEQKPSRIYIDGKRLGHMRPIVKGIFSDSFLSIDVKMPDRIFVLRLSDVADVNKVKDFSKENPLCKIEIFPRIEMIIFKGRVDLVPAR